MYYIMFPEVAGGLGSKTILDNSVFPPVVKNLNYEFDGWLGDDLLESFPCFIVSESLKNALIESDLKGFQFSRVLVTKSHTFIELYPDRELPSFYWIQINGKLCIDDFSVTEKSELVISSQAKKLLSNHNISHAVIKSFKND